MKLFLNNQLIFWGILIIPVFILPPGIVAQTGIPGQMVEISATIYEFRYDKESQFGIFYEYNRSKGALQNSNIFLPGTENIKDKAIPALDISGNLFNWDYGAIDFNIKTAINEGWGTIINNPTLLVADGEPSSLIGGEEVPLTVLTITGNQSRLELSKRKVGIKLNVTPRIFRENTVLMNLEIESSEIIRFDTFDRGDKQRYELPVVTTRNVKTVVIIPSGRKLYIGGLYTDTSGDIRRKVPILGDIPGLGYAFSGFNKKKRRTETVFQITPIIASPGSGLSTADDSVFSDLLNSENSTEYIKQKQILDNIKQQHDGMLPAGQASAAPKPAAATPAIQAGTGTIVPATAAAVIPATGAVPSGTSALPLRTIPASGSPAAAAQPAVPNAKPTAEAIPATASVSSGTAGAIKIPPPPDYAETGQNKKDQTKEKKARSKSRPRFYFR